MAMAREEPSVPVPESVLQAPAGDSRKWFMRRLNLFEGMSDKEIEEVSHMLRQQKCEPGQQIVEPDDEHVFLLKAGQVRLYRLTTEGQETTTALLRPGQLFNIGGMAGETHAEAVTPSVVCDASAAHFMGVLARHPLLMARVTMTMARQIFQLEETIERMNTSNGRQRVAATLIALIDAPEGPVRGADVGLNQVQIAKVAGLTRETVARSIASLREEGLVNRAGPIRILDLEGLRRAAGG
jgi:CRP/FNR family transcriptional regulator